MTEKEISQLRACLEASDIGAYKAWKEERRMEGLYLISERTLERAAFYLNDKYVVYLAKASKASKPERKTKYMTKARELKVLLDEIYAVLDPKE